MIGTHGPTSTPSEGAGNGLRRRGPTPLGAQLGSSGFGVFHPWPPFPLKDDTTAIVTPRVALRSRSHERCDGAITR
jgi:hypothetical protein